MATFDERVARLESHARMLAHRSVVLFASRDEIPALLVRHNGPALVLPVDLPMAQWEAMSRAAARQRVANLPHTESLRLTARVDPPRDPEQTPAPRPLVRTVTREDAAAYAKTLRRLNAALVRR